MNDSGLNSKREFAIQVVKRLRDAGFESLWAGGCVRDQLLGMTPKDYDVATNATPDEVQAVFGRRRTTAVGAAFGVVMVLGGKAAGNVEVATFRRDAAYSDGRHPDSVTFSSAEEDARRRDFTINGLFYDPLSEHVIDYVGGRDDIQRGVLRAIGDAEQRINEDKLRMLRAVRFTANYGLTLDPVTLDAVKRHAAEISLVSAERIAEELRKMLVHENRAEAIRLLGEAGLLWEILPESKTVFALAGSDDDERVAAWRRMLAVSGWLSNPGFPLALAGLLWEIARDRLDQSPRQCVESIARRWKLSNDESRTAAWLLSQVELVRRAGREPWPRLQRVLIDDRAPQLVQLAAAIVETCGDESSGVQLCRERLAWPPDRLNPPALIDGDDLRVAGISPGPQYKGILQSVRDAQLEGRISDKSSALDFAKSLLHSS